MSAHEDPSEWVNRDLFALDADVTVYWPDVRPCYDAQRSPEWHNEPCT